MGTKHGIRTMLPTGGGTILNWSSTGGMNGSRLPTSAYSAAKAGVISIGGGSTCSLPSRPEAQR